MDVNVAGPGQTLNGRFYIYWDLAQHYLLVCRFYLHGCLYTRGPGTGMNFNKSYFYVFTIYYRYICRKSTCGIHEILQNHRDSVLVPIVVYIYT